MKRIEKNERKFDFVFMAIVLAAIALISVISYFMPSNREIPMDANPLPDNETNTTHKLIISEVLSNNAGFYFSAQGNDLDYIELYNGKDSDMDLTGYGLSDDKNKVKWMFPDGTTIKAKSYLVITLTGSNIEGLNANFKLKSSGGETIILVNKGKKIIDAVDTVNTNKNQPMVRDGNGGWYVADYPTPGFENSRSGLDSYLNSIVSPTSDALVINEFLCKNAGNYVNEFGRMDGYIELKNCGDEPLNLSEYSLSNDVHTPFKKMLPEVILQPNEIFLLHTGDAGFLQENYIGFQLSNKSGSIVLSHNGMIVEHMEYANLTNGLAKIRMGENTYIESNVISPGYENTDEGIELFQKQYLANKTGLVINEVMSDNSAYLAQNGDRYYDWVELYNNSNEAISLKDYCLSTRDSFDEFELPDVVLQPQQYYVIMCSGDSNLTNQSYVHAPFKISEAESLYLSKKGVLVDSVMTYHIPKNCSYGIVENGYGFMEKPSPKASNNAGKRTISLDPVFSLTAGIYNNVDELKISIDGYGTIYYTLDGSDPTTSSKVYSGPITLKKTSVIKALCVDGGKIKSNVITASYIVNENHTLPVMSVSLPQENFQYLNNNSWEDIDIPCNAELFEDGKGFNVGCAISCFGGNSRNMDKKSYAIKFDSDWGVNNLVYPLFEHRDNSVYESIVLRQGSNDWTRTVFRDVMATSLMDGYVDTQDYKACVLYINGQYWGLYNIREKVNKAFISEHYNVSKDSVNIVNVDMTIKTGDNQDLLDLIYYIKTHDLRNNSYYEYVCSKLDVVNVCDYWIAEMYCVNPDVFNVRYFNSTELDDGKWKYIYYDMDHAFRFADKNYYYEYLCNPYGMTGWVENTYDNTIPRDLFDNQQFVDLWLERLAYHLQNTFTKEKVNAALDHFVELYKGEIERDRKEWSNSYDDVVGEYPTMTNYYSHINVIKSFINQRQSIVLKQTKAYFGLSDTQMKEIFGDLW